MHSILGKVVHVNTGLCVGCPEFSHVHSWTDDEEISVEINGHYLDACMARYRQLHLHFRILIVTGVLSH